MLIERDQLAAALPGYDVGQELGRGDYGVVFAGRHRRVGGDVAIKLLTVVNRADPGLPARFLESGRLVSSLEHPHIARVHDYIEHGGVYALVTERLLGGTLRQRERRRITPEVACAIGLAVAGALDVAHARHITHLDIKPANVLFTSVGSPKITDFGLAALVDGSKTQTGRFGTPRYLAPEQVNGTSWGPPADLYALGVVLYEIFTGRPPFGRNLSTTALLHSHLALPPAPMDDIPPPFAAVVGRLLAKSPDARYPSARALALALARAGASVFGTGWLGTVDTPIWLDDEVRAVRGGRAAPTAPRGPGPAWGAAGRGEPGAGTPSGGAPGGGAAEASARAASDFGAAGGTTLNGDGRAASRRTLPGGTVFVPGAASSNGSPDAGVGAGAGAGLRTEAAAGGVGAGATTGATTGAAAGPGAGVVPAAAAMNGAGPGAVPAGRPRPGGEPGSGHDDLYEGESSRRRTALVAGGAIVTAMVVGAILAVLVRPDGSSGSGAADRAGGAQVPVVASRGASARPAGPQAPGAFSGTPIQVTNLEAYMLGIDRADNLYLNLGESQVVKVTPGGQLVPLTGGQTMGYGGDGGRASTAAVSAPAGVAVDPTSGAVYVSDSGNNRVRKITGGTITTVAGTGVAGAAGDGGPAAKAQLSSPAGIAFDARTRRLYIAEQGGGRIRVVYPDGTIGTLAGGSGLAGPSGLAVDAAGDVLVAETDAGVIVRIQPSGAVSTVAGRSVKGFSGDGGPATQASLFRPVAVWVAGDGTVYIADRDNNRVREVLPNGTIGTEAGTGDPANGGDHGPAVRAPLNIPDAVVMDSAGNLYLADYGNNAVRRISRTGIITTVISR